VAATCSDLNTVNGGAVILGDTTRTFTVKAISGLAGIVSPESITAGDYNHDGKLDIAVGSNVNPGGTVAVFHGNGDGTFASPAPVLTAGVATDAVATGDFNHDGRDDIVAANVSSADLTVFLQNMTGGFAAGVPYGANSSPECVVVADINKDQKLDILSCDGANEGVVVLLGKGDGTFPAGANGGSPPEYGVHPTPGHLAVGDLDQDGFSDVVTADQGGEGIDILRGKGDGTFEVAMQIAPLTTPADVAVGDFNGDGLVDIIIANNRSTGGVTLLLNTSK
jgi:hypothetical protein